MTADMATIAFTTLKINFRKSSGGCWWEKCLQNEFEDMIEAGIDIAIVYDFDSAFETRDVALLLKMMSDRPDIDALAGMQPQRGHGAVMMQLTGEASGDFTIENLGTPIKARTAHFGLTAIRLQRLKDVPRPWFQNIPGKDGSWRRGAEGHLDADIYFWRKLENYGRSLYVLPAITLGHIEDTVAKTDWRTGETVHYYGRDWAEGNHSNPITVKK